MLLSLSTDFDLRLRLCCNRTGKKKAATAIRINLQRLVAAPAVVHPRRQHGFPPLLAGIRKGYDGEASAAQPAQLSRRLSDVGMMCS